MTLKVIGIDAELNSLSNGGSFKGGHRAKNRVFTSNTGFFTLFYWYILLIFVLRLGMTLKVVGIDAELNSLSASGSFKGSHRAKNRVLTPNTLYSTNVSCRYSL